MPTRLKQLLRSARSGLPSLVVFAVLAILAIGGAWTDWHLSRLRDLWGGGLASQPPIGGKEAPRIETGENPAIRFASPEALEKSGLKTAVAERRSLSRFVVADGVLQYDRTRLSQLSTRAPGSVWKVYRRLGEAVRKGDVLALVNAAEVGRAKAEYLEAFRNFQLNSLLLERARQAAGSLPERRLQDAEAARADARIRLFNAESALVNLGLPIHADRLASLSQEQMIRRLQFLGLPEAAASTLDPDTTPANLLPLVAPFDGVVTRSDMVEGEVVNSNQPQFVVADLRRLWVMVDVRQEDAGAVQVRQRVTFRPDGAPDLEAAGTVSWVSPVVNDKTRTVPVRAEVENPGGRLLVDSFGTGRILVAEKPDALVVPTEAVQWAQPYPLVFVRRADGLSFEPRRVRLGIEDHGSTEVLDGLRPGEVVATAGSHMLRSELFKAEIGAGD